MRGEVGYESALTFSRAFACCVGLTPSRYHALLGEVLQTGLKVLTRSQYRAHR